MKNLIFIENENHAREYLKHRDKFKVYIPIVFNFQAENLLEKNGIDFKTEEEYEKNLRYEGIHSSSIKTIKKLFENYKIEYKEINLMELFFYEIYIILSSSKRNLILFREIIKREKPEKIIVFQHENPMLVEEEFASRILPHIFTGKIFLEKYTHFESKNKKKTLLNYFAKMQNIFSKLFIQTSRKNSLILSKGGKQYFRKVLGSLIDDKKKIIEFGETIGKSFWISKRIVPYLQLRNSKIPVDRKIYEEIIKKANGLNELILSKAGVENELCPRVREYLKKIILSNFLNSCRNIEEMISLLKKGKVKLILLNEDTNPFGSIIPRVSKKFGVPTIVFHHGFFINEIGQNSTSDYIIVYGEESKKEAINAENKLESIKVFGSPRYDEMIKNNTDIKNQIVYAMEISNGNNALTPETQLSKRKQKEILKIVFRTMKKFPEKKLILKTRPGWDMSGLPEKIAEEEKFDNFEVIEKTDNTKLINESEIILVNHTTMGLEALMLEKPVISISYKEYNQTNFFRKIKNVPIVYNQKELEYAIKKTLSENETPKKERMESLKKFLILDKNASKRSFEFIKTLKTNY